MAVATRAQARELSVGLTQPGMTVLHRVGLAGLWMTLQALDEEPALATPVRNAGGAWTLSGNGVTLSWTDFAAFFRALIAASFRVEDSGLIHFTGLGPPSSAPEEAVVLQDALLGTFLQHGRTRKADPSNKAQGSLTIGEEEHQRTVRFRKVTHYVHQDAVKDLRGPDRTIQVAGWAFPGGAVRHTASHLVNDTALAEPLARYLCLLYAPVGAYFFQLHQRGQARRAGYCIVLPDLVDLEEYAVARKGFHGAQTLSAAGGAEAALRVLVHLAGQQLQEELEAVVCRVIEFGVVPWASQQKTRVRLHDLEAMDLATLNTFRAVEQVFRPQERVNRRTGETFLSVPQAPELIARNCLVKRSWWLGFAEFTADSERRQAIFREERGGLQELVEAQTGMNSNAMAFVGACHEAWRHRLGSIGERVRDPRNRGMSFRDQAGREYDRARIAFSRCKSLPTFRQAITDFWARGRANHELQEHWAAVLPFLNPKGWQEGRDLALLALASYRPRTQDERDALSAAASDGGDQ